MKNRDEVRQAIDRELNSARLKFPLWPRDPVHQAAIVAEEAGEALKEALDMREDDPHEGTQEKLEREWVQAAAMAIRALEGY